MNEFTNWLKYATGRYLPFTIRTINKNKASIAYKLGYGDYVWSKMNRGYIDSKGFRFKEIPLKDRINDRSTKTSDFFGCDAAFRDPFYYPHARTPAGLFTKFVPKWLFDKITKK